MVQIPTPRLVLASASPARLDLLRRAGFAPEVQASTVDEDGVEAATVGDLVLDLAVRKAVDVARHYDDAVVVGCDSLLDVDGRAHGKPTSTDEALGRLRGLRGRSAELRTGHCVIDTRTGAQAAAVASTTVHFGTFTDDELRAYMATGEAMAVAGAFTLDGRSAPFLDGIDGDPSNVIGLSLPLLRQLLAELGIGIVELWS